MGLPNIYNDICLCLGKLVNNCSMAVPQPYSKHNAKCYGYIINKDGIPVIKALVRLVIFI